MFGQDEFNVVQAEIEREKGEARDSLGVNDEASGLYSRYPRQTEDMPIGDGFGCTDSALCDDLEWGGERDTFDSGEEDREPDTLDTDNDKVEIEGAGA